MTMTGNMLSSSPSSFRNQAVVVVLVALIGQAAAYNCYVDIYGNQQCDGVGYGERAGIGAAIIIAILVLLFALLFSRRRRMQRLQQQQQQQQSLPQQGYYAGPGQETQAPYQPGLYESNPTYNYGPDAQAWQPPPPKYEGAPQHTERSEGAPYYAPPAGAPPNHAAGYQV